MVSDTSRTPAGMSARKRDGAREELILTRASTRLRRGREVPRAPSRFLADIPESLLEVSDTTVPPPGPPTEAERGFFRAVKARLQGGPPVSSA